MALEFMQAKWFLSYWSKQYFVYFDQWLKNWHQGRLHYSKEVDNFEITCKACLILVGVQFAEISFGYVTAPCQCGSTPFNNLQKSIRPPCNNAHLKYCASQYIHGHIIFAVIRLSMPKWIQSVSFPTLDTCNQGPETLGALCFKFLCPVDFTASLVN